jgi:hypothetical protein
MSTDDTPYAEKLRDPRWQKLRLEVMSRDQWRCQTCRDSTSTLAVHHRYYLRDREPWEYPLDALVTLCEWCHAYETRERPAAEQQLLATLRKANFSIGQLRALTTAIAIADQDTPRPSSGDIKTNLVQRMRYAPLTLWSILEILNYFRLIQEKFGCDSDVYRLDNEMLNIALEGLMAQYEQWRVDEGLNPTPPVVEGGWDRGPA